MDFCDASLQVWYIRTTYAEGNVTVKDFNVKNTSVSHKASDYSAVLARLVTVVKKSLEMLGDMDSHFWTDSIVIPC